MTISGVVLCVCCGFFDGAPETRAVVPAAVRAAITERTVGIQPVHLYGHRAPMDQIMAIAREHDLWVFADAAQAHGATWDGQQVGTFGQAGMFSLYPTKNMTSGEGGMVSCGSGEHARQVRLLRNQGMETQYANEVAGFNNRMTDIHAAIGRDIGDRKSTRLNSSHVAISYAVFCLKKKKLKKRVTYVFMLHVVWV